MWYGIIGKIKSIYDQGFNQRLFKCTGKHHIAEFISAGETYFPLGCIF